MLRDEDALRAYAAMLNTFDVEKLGPLLADDFHYASQLVFSEIESKQEFLDYITAKLRNVKASGSKVWAEIGAIESRVVLSDYCGRPCVLVAQGRIDKIRGVVFAEVMDNKIKRMDMCMAELYSVRRSGEYPR
jgi:hypothetical protein